MMLLTLRPLFLKFLMAPLFALAFHIGLMAQTNTRIFSVTGVVRSPQSGETITIEHEEIPGFMPAMTMPFYADPAETASLTAGDRVQFEFHVGETSRATNFRKLPASPTAATPAPVNSAHRAIRRLRAGDTVPPFSLVDEQGSPLTSSSLEGRLTLVTFIFTRCPVPEFCPLISRKFQEVQTAAAANDSLQLLSISIDPEHDRPAVLQAYSRSLDANPATWKFATGSVDEVAKLTRAFAVRTEFNNGRLDHTLATALIGPDGRVIEIWRGNAWKPAEVLAKIASGAPQNRRP